MFKTRLSGLKSGNRMVFQTFKWSLSDYFRTKCKCKATVIWVINPRVLGRELNLGFQQSYFRVLLQIIPSYIVSFLNFLSNLINNTL